MRFPEPQRTEVDGIPVWYSDVPGPCLAGLVFRVGRADESLPLGGVSHLVEHLALERLAAGDYDMNGSVRLLTTDLRISGTQEEAERFLREACESLSDLQLDRLDIERRILRTEAFRSSGSAGRTMTARFGNGTFGLVDWFELGLRSMTPDQVGAWCRERFNRANAVLWMTRPPTDALRLPLPEGSLFPPRPLELSPYLVAPAHAHGPPGSMSCSMLARREMPLYVAVEVARRRAFDQIRREQGLSYSAFSWEERLGPDDSMMSVGIDALPDHEEDVTARFVALLEAVAAGPLTSEEVARACEASMPWSSTNPSRPAFEAARMAVGDLIEHAPTGWDELERQAETLTPEAVATAFATALETALLVVPEDVEPGGRFEPVVAEPPSRRMQGRLYVRWDGNTVDEVIASPEGVSRATSIGSISSVDYDDCVAVTIDPRGTMWMFGRWGNEVRLDLNQLRRGHELAKIIQDRVGDRWVDLHADAIGWFSVQSAMERHDAMNVETMWRELELLASVRAFGERILAVAFADLNGRGILAATDARVLHLSHAREAAPLAAWDRADITGVRVSSGLRGARLHIHLDGRVVSFDQVRPRSLASEFELLLAPVIEEDASQEGSADAGSARSGTPGDEPSSP